MNDVSKTISLVLGVLGFVISLINLGIILYSKRTKITIEFTDLKIGPYFFDNELVAVYYKIQNNSQLPIAITRIELIFNNQRYETHKLKEKAHTQTHRSGDTILDKIITYTEILPINLGCLAASSGFLAFQVPQGTIKETDTEVSFQIYTSRGKTYQKKLILDHHH